MRKLLITSLVLAGVGATALPPAMAEETSIEVLVPADLSDPAIANAYQAELTAAIQGVCRKATAPVIGINYYTMTDCIKRTTAKVAAEEPTGILAESIGATKPVVLADQTVR